MRPNEAAMLVCGVGCNWPDGNRHHSSGKTSAVPIAEPFLEDQARHLLLKPLVLRCNMQTRMIPEDCIKFYEAVSRRFLSR
jgi:hypothetical protein